MDIRALTLTGLRRNIGVVFQETLLFNRSIAENLRVGKPDATDEEMREAAARAQALDFIERNPEGFERRSASAAGCCPAASASGSSIARALLKDPPILILDEATSALDAVTEAQRHDGARRGDEGPHHFRHRASARHRSATPPASWCSATARIVESGTFDELVQRGGFFAELAQAQFPPPAAPGEGELGQPAERGPVAAK